MREIFDIVEREHVRTWITPIRGPWAEEPSSLTAGRPDVFGKQKLVFLTMDRFLFLDQGLRSEIGRAERGMGSGHCS